MSAAPQFHDATRANLDAAARFLSEIAGTGLVQVGALADAGMKGRTFCPSKQNGELRHFLDEEQKAHANLYFTLNEPVPPSRQTGRNGALAKPDIAMLRGVTIDLDPIAKVEAEPGGFDRERQRLKDIAKALLMSACPPSLIVDTGNGVQAHWLFQTLLPAIEENNEAVERQARGLIKMFGTGSDAVQSIQHLFRCPHTTNFPDARKLKRGRTVRFSSVWHYCKKRYTLEELAAYVAPLAATPKPKTAKTAKANGKADPADNPLGLYVKAIEAVIGKPDALPAKIREKINAARKKRRHVDELLKPLPVPLPANFDRSEHDYEVICALRRYGFDPQLIAMAVAAYFPLKIREQWPGYLLRYTMPKAIAAVDGESEAIAAKYFEPPDDEAADAGAGTGKVGAGGAAAPAQTASTGGAGAGAANGAAGGQAGQGTAAPQPQAGPAPPQRSEDLIAFALALKVEPWARYVGVRGLFFVFDGKVWRADDTDLIRDRARKEIRHHAGPKDRALASNRTISGVVNILKTDRWIAATADQWDRDPWALNTPGGLVDLTTGLISPTRPEDFCTRLTAVAPDFEAACPLWMAFLKKATAGDVELQKFLQRLAGYSLSGSTREEAIFFLYGTGGNGKGVFTETLAFLMGDYHTQASITTFTEQKFDAHPTEIARLRGARLVTATETEQGRHWAESRIKELTGGGKVTGRHMRQDFFEFVPEFTLVISGNHRPVLRSVDESTRRRFYLLPFDVTIPKEERDKKLKQKLRKDEAPAILAWAIEGCLAWGRIGLAPPEAVLAATAKYLDAEDAFKRWFAECLARDTNAHSTSAELYDSWHAWATKADELVGSEKALILKFKKEDYRHNKQQGRRGISGVRIVRSGRQQREDDPVAEEWFEPLD